MSQNKTVFLSVFLSVLISLGAGYFYLQSIMPSQSDEDFAEQVVAVFDTDENTGAVIDKFNAYAQKMQEEANKPQKVDFEVSYEGAPMKGDVDAPVTIVEFSEYECPYCQRHAVQTIPQLQQYIDAGQVKYYFRDYVVHGDGAELRSEVAHCVDDQLGDEAYFQMHDLLFNEGFEIQNGEGALDALVSLATDNIEGIDGAALKSCAEAGTHAEEIAQNGADGKEYGVTGTPSFFVNGYFVKGAYPFETFQEIIEAELAQ